MYFDPEYKCQNCGSTDLVLGDFDGTIRYSCNECNDVGIAKEKYDELDSNTRKTTGTI